MDSRVFGPHSIRRENAYKPFLCARCRQPIAEDALCGWTEPDSNDPYCDACCTAVETGVAP